MKKMTNDFVEIENCIICGGNITMYHNFIFGKIIFKCDSCGEKYKFYKATPLAEKSRLLNEKRELIGKGEDNQKIFQVEFGPSNIGSTTYMTPNKQNLFRNLFKMGYNVKKVEYFGK